MKTIAAILVLFALGSPGLSQTKEDNQLSPNVRIYEPKNLSQERALRVAEFVTSVISGSCHVNWDNVPHALVIRSMSPADLDAAEALLKRFDVPLAKTAERRPSPAFDCTVYLIRAFAASSRPVPPTSPIPPELQPAIDEMKHSFGYERYAVWDSLTIQPGGAGEMQGILPLEPASTPYVYTMTYRGAGSSETRDVYLNGFQFSVKMPFGKDGIESHIKTDVTIHEGQKLVLGKIRLLPAENADLFLVLATKLH